MIKARVFYSFLRVFSWFVFIFGLSLFFRPTGFKNLFPFLNDYISTFAFFTNNWFYSNPISMMILIAITSFSALFIAPLNSFSNIIKEGNFLQVSYVRENFNYRIISRYLITLALAIITYHLLFSIFCMCIILVDILIFYRKYTSFLFHNSSAVTQFLTQKIDQENKTRKDFFLAFEEMKTIVNRFEKKIP